MKVRDIYEYIDKIATFSLQEGYDNSGLVIGSMESDVQRVLVALDVTKEIAQEAAQKGAQLIVTHHPPIFRAIKRLDTDSVAVYLAARGINVISAHTNFDSAVMNDLLCEKLGLSPVLPLHTENGVPCGCVCECTPISASDMSKKIKTALGCKVVRYCDSDKNISKVAVCSGSGGVFLEDAESHGCDAFITGDVKHSVFIDAHNASLTVFDAGHFDTENIFCEKMRDILIEGLSVQCEIAAENKDILNYEV